MSTASIHLLLAYLLCLYRWWTRRVYRESQVQQDALGEKLQSDRSRIDAAVSAKPREGRLKTLAIHEQTVFDILCVARFDRLQHPAPRLGDFVTSLQDNFASEKFVQGLQGDIASKIRRAKQENGWKREEEESAARLVHQKLHEGWTGEEEEEELRVRKKRKMSVEEAHSDPALGVATEVLNIVDEILEDGKRTVDRRRNSDTQVKIDKVTKDRRNVRDSGSVRMTRSASSAMSAKKGAHS